MRGQAHWRTVIILGAIGGIVALGATLALWGRIFPQRDIVPPPEHVIAPGYHVRATTKLVHRVPVPPSGSHDPVTPGEGPALSLHGRSGATSFDGSQMVYVDVGWVAPGLHVREVPSLTPVWDKVYHLSDLQLSEKSLPLETSVLAATPDLHFAAVALTHRKEGTNEIVCTDISILDLQAHKEVTRLRDPDNLLVWGMAISPDGHKVVTAGNGCFVWDVRSGTKTALPGWPYYCVAFSPKGTFLATSTSTHGLQVLDAHALQVSAHRELPDRPCTLVFSGDEEWIAAGYASGNISIFDSRTLKAIARMEGPHCRVTGISMSADRSLLLASFQNSYVRAWDLVAWRELSLSGPSGCLAGIVPGKDMFVTLGQDGTQLWTLPSPETTKKE